MTKQASDRIWTTTFPKFTSVVIMVQGTPGHVFLQTLVEAASPWVSCEDHQLGTEHITLVVMTA